MALALPDAGKLWFLTTEGKYVQARRDPQAQQLARGAAPDSHAVAHTTSPGGGEGAGVGPPSPTSALARAGGASGAKLNHPAESLGRLSLLTHSRPPSGRALRRSHPVRRR